MQADLFGAPDPGNIRARPGARIENRTRSIRASGRPDGPGRNPGTSGRDVPARPRPSPADTLAAIQEIKQRIESLGGEVMEARDMVDATTKAALPYRAAFSVAHELAAEFVQANGIPPYGGGERSAAFLALVRTREARSREAYPFKRAQDAAERVLKALVSELKNLNAELESHERLLERLG